ncbi:Leucine--tRNA ligase cytoplasmic [Dissostichus eleginoides]|uniref:Leucine--tRNA ligase cytoplasmic n=1 Tax=Dissostichus eleginoides TaxID=100907 RepID=A0AAD9F462_DISEL|nr:Leucine--tRNA ligase cytoplasmic [Dissostichus eleginoides]
MLRSLKKRGNFDHNATVASCGAGEMVACRRPSKEKQSDDYRHCKFCQGLYARDCLWRHVKNCPQKPYEGEPQGGRKRIHLDLPKPDSVQEAVWKIACEMNQDDISSVVRSERDILSLGHDIRVHREFYRLPESTLQLAKVSKLLIAMEKGRLSDLQGKGLDDIEINPEGSRSETYGDHTLGRNTPDATTLDNMESTSASTFLDNINISDNQPRHDSQKNTTLHLASNKASSKCSNGKQAGKMRSKWTGDEVQAVEQHLFSFITSCRVPDINIWMSGSNDDSFNLRSGSMLSLFRYFVFNETSDENPDSQR